MGKRVYLALMRRLHNNKILLLALVLLILIISVYSFKVIENKSLGDNKIRELLIGQELYLEGNEIIITENNILDFKVYEKNKYMEDKKKVKIKMDMVIEGKVISLEYYGDFIYKNKWVLCEGGVSEVYDIKIDDNIEELLVSLIHEKDLFFYDNSNVFGYRIKELSDINLNKEGLVGDFNGKATLTNGMYYTSSEISGCMKFNLNKLVWEVYNIKINSIGEVLNEVEINEDVIKDEIKYLISMENNNPYEYKYSIDERELTAKINIFEEVITDINIINYEINNEDNTIKYIIAGVARKEILQEINFNGNVTMPIDIRNNISSKIDIKISNIKITEPSYNDLRSLILNQKVKDYTIGEEDLDSFEIIDIDNLYITKKYVNSKINLNGIKTSIQIQLKLGYNKEGNQIWELSNIYLETMKEFEPF